MDGPRLLRPLEYGELFSEAFDLYKRNFVLFAGIGAVVFFPCELLRVFTAQLPVVAGLVGLVIFLAATAANGAIVKGLADRYLGYEATIAGSWQYVLRRLGRFVVTSLLIALMAAVGMVLLCIPGIIVLFWSFFLWSVMIVEDRYFRDAIRRCGELARGQYRRILNVFGMVILISLAYAMVSGLILAIPTWIGTAAATSSPAVSGIVTFLQGLSNAAIQTVVTPITAIMEVLLYFDVRVRKEGFDIELLAREMGEGAG